MVGEPAALSADYTGAKGRRRVGKRLAPDEQVEEDGTGAIIVKWENPIAGGNPSRDNGRSRRGRQMQTQGRMPIPGLPCLFRLFLRVPAWGELLRLGALR